jgi:hypothetical protein
MAILNRSDEVERLVDAVIIAAQKFVQTKSDSISDADIKRLFAKRAARLHVQRTMRATDPNLHSRITISMTGSV